MPRFISTDDPDEQSPLLGQNDQEWLYGNESTGDLQSLHQQYCRLVGLVPSNLPPHLQSQWPKPSPNTLYQRTKKKHRSMHFIYTLTASVSTTLLLSQVVIGAALTGLGAFEANHILISVFGAVNTVIAACVTYLKSRGQPMRARMFRDDLERIVDEIENSEVMWYGVARGMHGYAEIDTDEVSVRSEVARLSRLYERAIRSHLQSNPDFQQGGGGGENSTALRAKGSGLVAPVLGVGAGAGAGAAGEEEQSPATMAAVKEGEDDDDNDKDGKVGKESKDAKSEVAKGGESSTFTNGTGDNANGDATAESSSKTNGKSPTTATPKTAEPDVKDPNESPATAVMKN